MSTAVPTVLHAEDGEVPSPPGVYPLNWDANVLEKRNHDGVIDSSMNITDNIESQDKIYPDFHVWKQTEKDDEIMENNLQKGYIEPQFVKYEDQSGRHLMSSLFENEPDKQQTRLNIMGQVFIDAMHARKVFNGIKTNNVYKPPPRVTLTEHKKETWLKKLANTDIPLMELSRAIPHGLRNKFLLEQCLYHEIPISRAIWLIKCISTNEQRQLRRKNNNLSTNLNVNRWIVEWTEQITAFCESIIESCMNQQGEKTNWRKRVNYTLELLVNLYSEDLMNRVTFLTWIVRYTSLLVNKIQTFMDIHPLLIYQLIIKLFWFKIIKYDYLTRELSESMLMLLFQISQFKKNPKFDPVLNKLAKIFQEFNKYLFYFNSDIFIIPNKWNQLKPYLKKLLDMDLPPVSEQFKLISYRNNSLNNDEFDRPLTSGISSRLKNSTLSPISPSPSHNLSLFSSTSSSSSASSAYTITKPSTNIFLKNSDGLVYDKISLILHNLNNFQDENIPTLSKIIFDDNGDSWKTYLHIIFQWGIHNLYKTEINLQRITLICSIFQFKISHLIQTKPKRFKQFKNDLENTIIDFVFYMSEILNYNNVPNKNGNKYDIMSFLILVNRLSNIKLFIISSYLRRLIASGVIYLSEPDRSCFIHILILNQLPKKDDTNLKSILGRLMDSTNWKITDLSIEQAKGENIELFNILLTKEDIYNDCSLLQVKQFSDIFKYNIPTEVGKHFEIGEHAISVFEKITRNSNKVPVYLTKNKITVLFELFKVHSFGLSKFLTILLELLNNEKCVIGVEPDMVTELVKMVVISKNILKSTIYNMKWNTWDYCMNLLKRLIDSKKHDITKCISVAEIPTVIFHKHFSDMMGSYKVVDEEVAFLSTEELNVLEAPVYDKLGNSFEFSHFMMINLMKFINYVKLGDVSDNIGLIIKYLRSLQSWKILEYKKCLFDYLRRSVKSTFQIEYESNLRIIHQLLVYHFVDINDIINIFDSEREESRIFANNFDDLRLFYDLFFNNDYFSNSKVVIKPDPQDSYNKYVITNKSHEIFEFEYLKYSFILNNYERYYQLFTKVCTSNYVSKNNMNMELNNINMNMNLSLESDNVNNTPNLSVGAETPVDSSMVNKVVDEVNTLCEIEQLNSSAININKEVKLVNHEVIFRFWEFATNKSKLFIKFFKYPMNRSEKFCFQKFSSFIFHNVLTDEFFGDNVDEMVIVDELDYFNLPILQLYFNYYMRIKESKSVNDRFYIDLIQNVMREGYNKYQYQYDKLIGELFVYLPYKSKGKILFACEEMYLNSESFPKVVIDGNIDVTKMLSCILWSVCKQNDEVEEDEVTKDGKVDEKMNDVKIPLLEMGKSDSIDVKMKMGEDENHNESKKEKKLVMNDALVFSLTSVLDKIIHIFNNLAFGKRRKRDNSVGNAAGITKEMEFGIKMVARIILLHREFLVELILKRSVNLQKDVLINNLMKMFNHKIIQKNPKMKNLLYDVLISIKVCISEQLIERSESKMNNSSTVNNNNFHTTSLQGLSSVNKPSSANSPGLWVNRGTSAPTPPSRLGVGNSTSNIYIPVANILNVKPPTLNNNLRSLLSMFDWSDTVPEREHRYYVIPQSWNEVVDRDATAVKFTERPFEQIESTGDPYNSAINIQLFGATSKRCNPE